MVDEFEKHSCEFKNESECEEELDEKVLDLGVEEEKHFNKIDDEINLEDDENNE